MNMLQHKILIVFDGGVDLLLLQLVVLLQLEFKLVDENFGLLFILDYSLVLVAVPIVEDFLKEIFRLELHHGSDHKQTHRWVEGSFRFSN